VGSSGSAKRLRKKWKLSRRAGAIDGLYCRVCPRGRKDGCACALTCVCPQRLESPEPVEGLWGAAEPQRAMLSSLPAAIGCCACGASIEDCYAANTAQGRGGRGRINTAHNTQHDRQVDSPLHRHPVRDGVQVERDPQCPEGDDRRASKFEMKTVTSKHQNMPPGVVPSHPLGSSGMLVSMCCLGTM